MSERTVDINIDPNATASDKITDADKESNKFVAEQLSRIELKNRVAEVFDRGVVGDRLFVDLPPDKDGQWVPNDKQAIYRMEALGYVIDQEYAPKRRLHDKGDGASYVGDVVHMVAPKIVREVIDEVKRERYQRVHAPRGGRQKEEKDFAQSQETLSGTGIKTIEGSKVDQVDSVDKIRQIIDPKR